MGWFLVCGDGGLGMCVVCSATKSCLTFCNSTDCSPLLSPPFTAFSQQGHWRGLPFPLPGYLPDPGVEPGSYALSCTADGFFTPEPSGKLRGEKGRKGATWGLKATLLGPLEFRENPLSAGYFGG